MNFWTRSRHLYMLFYVLTRLLTAPSLLAGVPKTMSPVAPASPVAPCLVLEEAAKGYCR